MTNPTTTKDAEREQRLAKLLKRLRDCPQDDIEVNYHGGMVLEPEEAALLVEALEELAEIKRNAEKMGVGAAAACRILADRRIQQLEEERERLLRAVRDLYYAAAWHADRAVDEKALWTAVRDAADFAPGDSPVERLEGKEGKSDES